MPRLEGDPAAMPLVLPSTRPTTEVPTGNWRNIRPEVDLDRCTGCALCWKFCPEACVYLKDGHKPDIDMDFCKGCGICAVECPVDCIAMKEERTG